MRVSNCLLNRDTTIKVLPPVFAQRAALLALILIATACPVSGHARQTARATRSARMTRRMLLGRAVVLWRPLPRLCASIREIYARIGVIPK